MVGSGSRYSEDNPKRFDIREIRGLTKVIFPGRMTLVIHNRDVTDEIFESKQRYDLIEAIKYVYIQETGLNIPIFGVQSLVI